MSESVASSTSARTLDLEFIDSHQDHDAKDSALVHQLLLLLQSEMISVPWRRPIGLALLGTTIFLWTASGFLASSIFADASYSKPYFITYFNNVLFVSLLLPFASKRTALAYRKRFQQSHRNRKTSYNYSTISDRDVPSRNVQHCDYVEHDDGTIRDRSIEHIRSHSPSASGTLPRANAAATALTTRETFWLSLKFALLWFVSNYFNAGSLQYTTVASTTILSSTSSVFTLILGAFLKVERFTLRKLFAVITCLVGVFIISRADTTGNHGDRGDFPYKSPRELALGDSMALGAAVLYGVYAVMFVKTIGDESRVNMPLFFGFLGLVTLILLWPGLLIFHWSGIEPFQIPPNGHTWAIIIINGASSMVADIAWAYSLLFISPLVVTVGLSLTIPLSLVGQMLLDSQYASGLYWVGAVIVLCSFVFVNYESKPLHEQGQHLLDSEN